MTGAEDGEIGGMRGREAQAGRAGKFGDEEILTWRFRIFSPFKEAELGQGREGGDEALIPNHGLLGHDEAYFFFLFFSFSDFPSFLLLFFLPFFPKHYY